MPYLLPEQRERDTLLGQFTVDVLVVDDCVRNSAAALFAVEQLIQHLVRHIIIERPCDVQFLSPIECCFDSLMRTVNASFDASLADSLSVQLKDFPIVRPYSNLLIQKSHISVCCKYYISRFGVRSMIGKVRFWRRHTHFYTLG